MTGTIRARVPRHLGLTGGNQDPCTATFGGINVIEFHANDRVIVNPLCVPVAVANKLESAMITCFTGVSRCSEQIIEAQQRRMTAPPDNARDV